MRDLLLGRRNQSLSENDLVRVGRVLLQGPVAQELKRTQGKEAGAEYASEVLVEARKMVERSQQAKRSQRRNCDQGMER